MNGSDKSLPTSQKAQAEEAGEPHPIPQTFLKFRAGLFNWGWMGVPYLWSRQQTPPTPNNTFSSYTDCRRMASCDWRKSNLILDVYYSWGFAAKILQLNAYADSTWALSSEGKKASAASYLCARQPTASSMAHSGSNSAYLLFLLPDVVIPMHLFHRAVGTKSEESLTYSNCSVNDGHIVYSLINSYFCKVGVMNGWRVWVWWRYIQGINVYLLKYFPYTQAPLGFVSGYVWV